MADVDAEPFWFHRRLGPALRPGYDEDVPIVERRLMSSPDILRMMGGWLGAQDPSSSIATATSTIVSIGWRNVVRL